MAQIIPLFATMQEPPAPEPDKAALQGHYSQGYSDGIMALWSAITRHFALTKDERFDLAVLGEELRKRNQEVWR